MDDMETAYMGTEVYETPTAACNKPCIMVIAPSPLDGTTTISIPPYTTSLPVEGADDNNHRSASRGDDGPDTHVEHQHHGHHHAR